MVRCVGMRPEGRFGIVKLELVSLLSGFIYARVLDTKRRSECRGVTTDNVDPPFFMTMRTLLTQGLNHATAFFWCEVLEPLLLRFPVNMPPLVFW